MNEKIISLCDKAVSKIKEILSKAESSAIGVRVGVKSGGCAGMSYTMEYAKEIKPNEEVIEDTSICGLCHHFCRVQPHGGTAGTFHRPCQP